MDRERPKFNRNSISDHSYGYRPKRNAQQALKKGCEYVEAGREHVVDLDLKTFFDGQGVTLIISIIIATWG